METWRLFWAKTNRASEDGLPTRPLWAHLIDVANTAQLLWDEFLPRSLRRRLAAGLGMQDDEDAAGHLLSLWIGLHDLGKAIPSFQEQHEHSKRALQQAGLSFESFDRVHHGHASIAIMRQWLKEQKLPPDQHCLFETLSAFVGFHHGKLCQPATWEKYASHVLGAGPWQQAQSALTNAVVDAWGLADVASIPAPNPVPDWMLPFAGWATLADWLGSMAEHYEDVDEGADLVAYVEESRAYARRAFCEAGLHVRAALQTRGGFTGIYDRWPPRALQLRMDDLPLPGSDEPTLTIIEAPTGEGKSEAAFYLAARQQSRHAPGGGIYVAMPSQATSNGLFERFKGEFLERAHESELAGGNPNVRLVHGNDLLHPSLEKMLTEAEEIIDVYDDDAERTRAGRADTQARTISWFLPRKRSLLAPYGIGTVDQAFLSVLYARHFFLRLFGLAGKTVIFDEVHAYDTYMSTLFVRLLQWLRAQGTHVILLSATLPEKTRCAFLEAWGMKEPKRLGAGAPYPAVWHTALDEPVTFTAAQRQHARVMLHPHTAEAVLETIRDAVSRGATVAVICNTVQRSQDLFKALRGKLGLPSDDLVLFHARFPFARRQQIEAQVLDRFGKGRSNRPGVLVATQVAEQSLDLDFDLMLSDLAPIDLLLQRAGRLHRHQDRERPPGFEDPLLYVLCPEPREGLPDVKEIGGGKIYAEVILWKTFRLVKDRGGWTLPKDYRALIEGVYDGDQAPPGDLDEKDRACWQQARRKFEEEVKKARGAAKKRLVPKPNDLESMLEQSHATLAEEDEGGANVAEQFRAMTRLSRLTIGVLCLHRENGRYWLAGERKPSPWAPGDAARKLAMEEIKDLLGASVQIGNERLSEYLLGWQDADWDAFTRENPILRRFKVLYFEDGWWSDSGGPAKLELRDDLGLMYHYSNHPLR